MKNMSSFELRLLLGLFFAGPLLYQMVLARERAAFFCTRILHFVEVTFEVGKRLLQSLPLSRLHDNLVGAGLSVEGISGQNLPVIEHALWEGLTASVGTEIGSKTE